MINPNASMVNISSDNTGGGFYGFNPDVVASSIDMVQSAYNELMDAIVTQTQSQFVNNMQDKWASPKARKFYISFKDVQDTLISDTNKTFQSVVDAMNSAANAWAQQTGATWSGKQLSRIDRQMDISCIKANINGVIGVEKQQAVDVANTLKTIAANASTALSNSQSAVSNSGFIGGSSQSSLNSSLGKIKTNIETAANELRDACIKAIEATVTEAINLESSVSQSFTGTETSV